MDEQPKPTPCDLTYAAGETDRERVHGRRAWRLTAAGILLTAGLAPVMAFTLPTFVHDHAVSAAELGLGLGIGGLGIIVAAPLLYVVSPAVPPAHRLHRNNAAERAMVFALTPLAWAMRAWEKVRRTPRNAEASGFAAGAGKGRATRERRGPPAGL